MSFHHSDVIPSFRFHSVIQMTFHHLSLILSITGHADNIPSFWCHSIHSMIIRAWNDTEWHFGGMTGMGLEWCFKSFKVHSHHSCHSKKVGFPWFHSCHSGLILSFRGHSKIQFQLEWCWNDKWFWAEVDYFPYMESGQLHLIHPHPRMMEWWQDEKSGSFLGHSKGMRPEWEGFHLCHSSIISSFGGHSDLEWPSNAKKKSFNCHSCNLT